VFKEAGFMEAQIQEFKLSNACSVRLSLALTNSGAPISSGGFNHLLKERLQVFGSFEHE